MGSRTRKPEGTTRNSENLEFYHPPKRSSGAANHNNFSSTSTSPLLPHLCNSSLQITSNVVRDSHFPFFRNRGLLLESTLMTRCILHTKPFASLLHRRERDTCTLTIFGHPIHNKAAHHPNFAQVAAFNSSAPRAAYGALYLCPCPSCSCRPPSARL